MYTAITILAIVATATLAVQTARLMKARQTIWHAMIDPYYDPFGFGTKEEELKIERIRELTLFEYRRLCAPIYWVGNATSEIDIKVNYFRGKVTYTWASGEQKTEWLRDHHKSGVLHDIALTHDESKSSSSGLFDW